ncbi:hypothetical protein BT96DRAFT_929930 [Gymnopus androsaceus JB14]|uniref:Uncharacterized protein n=1 Tax=Gymnopus androsaceus JB14 TaxID=1447944 RepID=A0A6A4GCT0_9AGAR|nr:hypothetical protein BT96DRAFT_929930 [Gymnopus androsaceus JB14]
MEWNASSTSKVRVYGKGRGRWNKRMHLVYPVRLHSVLATYNAKFSSWGDWKNTNGKRQNGICESGERVRTVEKR